MEPIEEREVDDAEWRGDSLGDATLEFEVVEGIESSVTVRLPADLLVLTEEAIVEIEALASYESVV